MDTKDTPIIYEIKARKGAVEELDTELEQISDTKRKLIINFPTVYIYDIKKGKKCNIYVGETGDIIRRTNEHLNKAEKEKVKKKDKTSEPDWHSEIKAGNTKVVIIGHYHFNKSLTLDIENRFIQYLGAVDKVNRIHNKRENSQNEYYTCEELDTVFSRIWCRLNEYNPQLFPIERIIKDSALFKASPHHKLTVEQYEAKREILLKIMNILNQGTRKQLIFIAGEAGTGKTVLNSSLFYELCTSNEEDLEHKNCYLLVNHKEQLKVYQQIARKLDLTKNNKDVVCKPARFINQHKKHKKIADIVLVDEAHLLLTQGDQGYSGRNQLKDIQKYARIVVVMFDKKQILRTNQYWEADEIEALENKARAENNFIVLKNQLRINAEPETINWIRDIIDKHKIQKIIHDKKGYDIKIFDTPRELHEAVKKKAKDTRSGLSRLVATFDWEYKDKSGPEPGKKWEVSIDDWSLPWNLQSCPDASEKELSWAEQSHTINEVGSTYTIQGFDLNYVGVILGPSVKYRNGRIVFDPDSSKNKKAIQNRKLKDGTMHKFAKTLLNNEINVLLTRGINGLYIYATDRALREALQKAQQK